MTYLEFLQKQNVDMVANFIVTLQLETVRKLCEDTGLEIDPTKEKEVLIEDCKKFLLEEIEI